MSIPDHLMEQLLYICRVPSARDALIEAIETGANDLTADEIAYDNADSGLAATDLQAAVDELAQGGGGGAAVDITYDNSDSGLSATDVQAAIDEVVSSIPTVGANVNLSNLTAPTAVNQDLLPAEGETINVGTIDAPFSAVNANSINSISGNLTLGGGGGGTIGTGAGTLNISAAGGVNFNTVRVHNIATPSFAGDVVDKNYVDTLVTGASGTFTTVDAKTVTVVNGLITSIV
jgi:hypothetical protein